MATGYYLQDNPNRAVPQFGWPRARVSGVIGIHTAENNTCFGGPDRGDLDVAEFVTRRTDYGSYHSAADGDSWRRWVHPSYAAWADTTNNAHAMSVSAAVRANDWSKMSGAVRRGVIINMAAAAADLVQVSIQDGLLSAPTPARRITAAEAIAGSRAGFYGHGETNPGTRYDPGADFDWDLFLSSYAALVGGTVTTVGNPTEDWLDTLTNDEKQRLLAAADRINGTIPDRRYQDGTPVKVAMEDTAFSKADGGYQNRILEQDFAPTLGRLEQALGTKLDKDDGHSLRLAIEAQAAGDAPSIAAAIVAAIGTDLAGEVVTALAERLAGEAKA